MGQASRKAGKKVIAIVMGTRPEAIKLSPVIQVLKTQLDVFTPRVVVTAQHREMMDQVLAIFNTKPDYDLDIMKENQTLHEVTAGILTKLRAVFGEISPDLVLVQGDTTTTLASALAAFYDKIPVGHVEAGLRTYNRYYPFPEEMNRRLVSSLATFHFTPTQRGVEILKREGVQEENIFVTGNTIVDALQRILTDRREEPSFPLLDGKDKIVLVTAHRRESLNGGLEMVCQSIRELLRADKDVFVVFPIHLNPKVQKIVRARLSNRRRVLLCEPLDYRNFVRVMQKSRLILTDSGGIQEEAPSIGTPVVVLRNETERVEAVASGMISITGLNPEKIVQKSLEFLKKKVDFKKQNGNPYGDGKASERIVSILRRLAKEGKI